MIDAAEIFATAYNNTDGAELLEYAAALAPLLDKGATIVSSFKAITGGGVPYINYGLNLVITV